MGRNRRPRPRRTPIATNLADTPFSEWVARIFDREITYPEWYFHSRSEDDDMSSWDSDDPRAAVACLTRLFEDPMPAIGRYHPRQIKQGLWYLASNASSNYMFAVNNAEVPWAERRRCLESFHTLFKRFFAPLCAPRLAHLEKPRPDPLYEQEMVLHREMNALYEKHMPPLGEELPPTEMGERVRVWDAARQPLVKRLEELQSRRVPWDPYPINSICYMWWDVVPIGVAPDDPHATEFHTSVLNVMERTLALDSIACQEAALHGLGHWHSQHAQAVEAIIDEFLRRAHPKGPLLDYARAAKTGCIQ